MSTGKNADGTIDVRVVLTVKVDPDIWAEEVMETNPDEVLLKEIRSNVKRWVRDFVEGQASDVPIVDHVEAQGVYG